MTDQLQLALFAHEFSDVIDFRRRRGGATRAICPLGSDRALALSRDLSAAFSRCARPAGVGAPLPSAICALVGKWMSSRPRRGLLDDLDDAAFERNAAGRTSHAQGRLSAIEWIRVDGLFS
jgi:hypothetical protein